MSTPNPQTTGGIGGAAARPPLPQELLFSDAPPGSVTDSQYLAENAQLKHDIATQYANLLAQIGYVDPSSGAFIPGSVEQQADISDANLRQQQEQAELGVDQNAQNSGILFSGVRGTQRAQADMPFVSQRGQLSFDTTNTLADLYRQATGLMGDYTTHRDILLSDAATRAAANAMSNPIIPAVDQAPPSITEPPPAPSVTTPPPTATGAQGPTYRTDVPDLGTAHPPLGPPPPGPVAYARGGEITEPTEAVMGELARPGDRSSHEVVIPRYRLGPKENKMLDKLMDAAGIRGAALGRIGHNTRTAEALHGMGMDEQAAALYEQRHPYAVHHGRLPGWVERGMADRVEGATPQNAGVPPSVVINHFQHPPQSLHADAQVASQHAGLGGINTGVFQHPIHNLAHRVGLAALARLAAGLHTGTGGDLPVHPMAAPGTLGDYEPPVPVDISQGFRAPPPSPTPVPVSAPAPHPIMPTPGPGPVAE